MRETADSPWAVLGLREGATLAEVRRAFRARAKATHPDHGGSRAEFEAVRAAFEAARARAAAGGPDEAAPVEPCRQPARRPMPVARPHVAPPPRRVTRAYDWTATRPATATATVTTRPRPRPAAARVQAQVPTSAEAFAAVLDAALSRVRPAA